jgi:hypothetical protein
MFGVNRNSTAYKVGSVAGNILSWAGVGATLNVLGKGLQWGAQALVKKLAAEKPPRPPPRRPPPRPQPNAQRPKPPNPSARRRHSPVPRPRQTPRARRRPTNHAAAPKIRGPTLRQRQEGRRWPQGSSCSFVPGTLVLLADGARKPIETLQVGDRVLATDPVTGEHGSRVVTATPEETATKHMVQIFVKATGSSAKSNVVTTTDNHPF